MHLCWYRDHDGNIWKYLRFFLPFLWIPFFVGHFAFVIIFLFKAIFCLFVCVQCSTSYHPLLWTAFYRIVDENRIYIFLTHFNVLTGWACGLFDGKDVQFSHSLDWFRTVFFLSQHWIFRTTTDYYIQCLIPSLNIRKFNERTQTEKKPVHCCVRKWNQRKNT